MTPSSKLRNALAAALAYFFTSTFVGCSFSPEYPEGTIACSASQPKDCPSGFSCVAGFCRSKDHLDAQAPRGDGQVLYPDGSKLDQSPADGVSPSDLSGRMDLAIPVDTRPGPDGSLDTGATDVGLAPRDVHPTDLGPGPDMGIVDTGLDIPVSSDATPDTNLDTNPGILPDANLDSPRDVPTCIDPCTVGATRCAATGIQTCALESGCPTWGTPAACLGRKVCQGTGTTAMCACPAAPSGCENGAGSVCATNTLRTCKVGPVDGCIYEDSSQDCPAGKPCQGGFPGAACTCPPPPTLCSAQGTYCESSSMVVTCGLDSNGCLASTTRTACATDKPCTGAFPSASCSCGAGPAECGGGTGTVCVGTGMIETCALTSAGCLAVSSIVDCPSGTTCQGSAPNAACVCPTPPAECSQGVGTSCDAQGRLVTCGRDANSCLVVTQREACPGVTTCGGTGPNARCVCPPAPSACPGKGTTCSDATTLLTCTEDAQGCISGAKSACDLTGKICSGSFPGAACVCPANPDCRNGVGASCLDDTTVLVCTLSNSGCLVSAKATCKPGTYCMAGSCDEPKPVGWYDDLRSKSERTSGSLLLTPIKIEGAALLRSIGIISRTEGTALVGLYDSDRDDQPYKAIVANLSLPLLVGRNETSYRDLASPVQLAPGTYWIATTFKGPTTIAASGISEMLCRINGRYVYGADFPSPWVEMGIAPSACPTSNFYLLVSPL